MVGNHSSNQISSNIMYIVSKPSDLSAPKRTERAALVRRETTKSSVAASLVPFSD